MRYTLVGLLVFCLVMPAAAASQSTANPPEIGHEEAVYYANAYADHYRFQENWSTQSLLRNLDGTHGRCPRRAQEG